MNNKLLISITLFIFFNCITISSQQENIDSAYTKYFKNSREIPYLHFNKTSFLKGEEVWFKAYVLDLNTQKLHKNTSNLYCGIYDSKGELKKRKMLYVKNGIASGNFKIDSTYTNKNYYIKAFTNYMRNFEEDESFLQKITILDNKSKEEEKEIVEVKYDLQILPEGGHVLANIDNVFGVVLKDVNGDVPYVKSASIVDEKGEEVLSFSLNQFGLRKVKFFIRENKEYSVKVVLENGIELIKKVPSKKLRGVTLGVEDLSDNMMKIVVKTNEKTLSELNDKKFYVLIHNTNSYLKKEVKFKKGKNSCYFFYKKKVFKYGTNIVTLFNDKNKPLAERVFFNYKKNLLGFLDVNLEYADNDSIALSLDKGISKSMYYLSASILPSVAKANNPSNTIYSKFFLKPYIKGEVKNSAYYFKNINRKKLQELDVLLLTQEWSKYNWYNIFNNAPIDKYEFEKGISVKGTINTDKKEGPKEVYLISDSFNLFLSEKTKNNNVEFKDLYLRENDIINISYSNKGTLEKQKGYFRTNPVNFDHSIKTPIENRLKFKEVNEIKPFILKNSELLDTVVIRKKRKEKLKNDPFIFSSGITRGYKIKEEEVVTVNDFLLSKGFRIYSNGVLNVRITNNRPGKYRTRVFLENFEITNSSIDLGFVIRDNVSSYGEIFINKGSGGEIHFFNRKEYKNKGKDRNIFNEYKIPLGFSVEKEYYQPKYASTNHATFKEYGAVYWKPDIIINSKKTTYLKFPRLNQKKIKVFIEGITEEGKLIYKEKVFNRLDKENN